jgi:predicted NAD/FAD-binding protein
VGRRELENGELEGLTFGQFLRAWRFEGAVADDYAVPLAAAIWSASRDDIRGFPAVSLLRFFDNHGLLRVRERPQWKTIVGGSRNYVRRIIDRFGGEVESDHAVRGVSRREGGIRIRQADGTMRDFDRVVLAVHADQALGLLEDPRQEEREALGAWTYNSSKATLHTDTAAMPPNRRAWASWNYRRTSSSGEGTPVLVTYHMNRLQGLQTKAELFVSLNAGGRIGAAHTLAEIDYSHPCFTASALAAQERIASFSGRQHTFYCGSYLGYGFHEDAVRSAVDVGKHFGIDL